MIRLIEPTMEYDRQIQDFRQEFVDTGDYIDGGGELLRYDDTKEWLDHIDQRLTTESQLAGIVPATQFLCLREEDGKIVGAIQIRHYLDTFLEHYAGHIGYCIRPSERRKGIAKEMLRLAFPECRKLGINRVLITCRDDNEASRRTILANGGVYESTVFFFARDIQIERYWIDLENAEDSTQTEK
ncbi:MAG: GNAT family N-acetyltransferase [Oscillospiraceae bacterium]|nr:GNAT family N-acetyltransferase [Oscillospiraceae bacterium]